MRHNLFELAAWAGASLIVGGAWERFGGAWAAMAGGVILFATALVALWRLGKSGERDS